MNRLKFRTAKVYTTIKLYQGDHFLTNANHRRVIGKIAGDVHQFAS